MLNQLNAWTWMIYTLTLFFLKLAKEITSTEMVTFSYVPANYYICELTVFRGVGVVGRVQQHYQL
jgi:hypothetical protein